MNVLCAGSNSCSSSPRSRTNRTATSAGGGADPSDVQIRLPAARRIEERDGAPDAELLEERSTGVGVHRPADDRARRRVLPRGLDGVDSRVPCSRERRVGQQRLHSGHSVALAAREHQRHVPRRRALPEEDRHRPALRRPPVEVDDERLRRRLEEGPECRHPGRSESPNGVAAGPQQLGFRSPALSIPADQDDPGDAASLLPAPHATIGAHDERSLMRIRKPSPAIVISCIALGIALSGTGYAALKIPANSVGTARAEKERRHGGEGQERLAGRGRLPPRPDPSRPPGTGGAGGSARRRRNRAVGRRRVQRHRPALEGPRRRLEPQRARQLLGRLQPGRLELHVRGDRRGNRRRDRTHRRCHGGWPHRERKWCVRAHPGKRRSQRRPRVPPSGLLLAALPSA